MQTTLTIASDFDTDAQTVREFARLYNPQRPSFVARTFAAIGRTLGGRS